MKKLIAGFFFILFNCVIVVEGHSIHLLPDFLGYALLALSLRHLADSKHSRVYWVALALTVFHGAAFLQNLLWVNHGSLWEVLYPIMQFLSLVFFGLLFFRTIASMVTGPAIPPAVKQAKQWFERVYMCNLMGLLTFFSIPSMMVCWGLALVCSIVFLYKLRNMASVPSG